MRQSHTEIWTHLVVSTQDYQPIFTAEWTYVIKGAIDDYLLEIPEHHGNYCILPDHIHFLIKLPDNMSLNDLVDQLKTIISIRLKQNFTEAFNFHWEKEFHAHSVSLNRLSIEKNILDRQEIKHKEMTLEEELKFFGM